MKKACSFLLGLVLLATRPAQAQFTYTTNGGTVTITGYTGAGGPVTIPSTLGGLSVTGIGTDAFFESEITSVTIPASVVNIGEGPFDDCILLSTITVNPGNPAYVSLDGVLFDISRTTLVQYPLYKTGTSYVIPGSVVTIGADAFGASDYLISVTIPDGVTSIGNGAF